MELRFPRPLRSGDVIGVTAPSSGVARPLWGRLDAGVDRLRRAGYEVRLGDALRLPPGVSSPVSAPRVQRAEELMTMLLDPAVRAVVPPWGGDLATDLLDLLDWRALSQAEPTWLVGWSDLSTVMVPLTVQTGWATLHGMNLMDTAYDAPAGLAHWLDLATADPAETGPVTQTSPGRFRSDGWDDYAAHPDVSTMSLDTTGTWSTLDGADATFSGRLIGGCVETVSLVAGSLADLSGFAPGEDLVVYLDVCEDRALLIGRMLHGLRHAGWFERAAGILVSRTAAPGSDGFSQRDAVADALGGLGVPVVLDVECGHLQPFLPLVNGAEATVAWREGTGTVTQTW